MAEVLIGPQNSHNRPKFCDFLPVEFLLKAEARRGTDYLHAKDKICPRALKTFMETTPKVAKHTRSPYPLIFSTL
jgi:hypothetical protein